MDIPSADHSSTELGARSGGLAMAERASELGLEPMNPDPPRGRWPTSGEDGQGGKVDHLGYLPKKREKSKPCYPLGIRFFGRWPTLSPWPSSLRRSGASRDYHN